MPVYIRDNPLPPQNGQAFFSGNMVTTAVENRESNKSAIGFDGSVEKANELYELWLEKGYKGAPASPVAFFREEYRTQRDKRLLEARIKSTDNNMVSKGFFAGWIEVLENGICQGPLYHYDIINAYLWAGLKGLPSRVRSYRRGDKNFMVLARIQYAREFLPITIENKSRNGYVNLTNEDIDHYGIICDIKTGVSWDSLDFSVEDILVNLTFLPDWAFKRITQSYWGVWAAHEPITGRSYAGGKISKEWNVYNRFRNMLWAQLIISRVTRRLHGEDYGAAKLTYVDSILTPKVVKTSDKIGGFKHIETFPKGVLIQAPGVWARMPDQARRKINYWYRHAGYASIY